MPNLCQATIQIQLGYSIQKCYNTAMYYIPYSSENVTGSSSCLTRFTTLHHLHTMIIYCFLLLVGDFYRSLSTLQNFSQSENGLFSAPNEDNFSTWKKKHEKMEFKTLLDFLKHHKMDKYEKQFMEHGYDDIDFVGEDVINDADLARLGINDTQDQLILMEAFKKKGYSQGKTTKWAKKYFYWITRPFSSW